MILEIDTSLLKKIGNINLNQLVFLTLVLDNNQKSNQGVAAIVSLVSDAEVQELIERDLIIKQESEEGIAYIQTEKLIDLTKEKVDPFDEFYSIYPTQVIRPDGTSDFLKKNKNNCRKKYSSILGRSRAKRILMHQHLIDCLNYELEDKTRTGKLGYLKTMWKWLTTAEWENSEEQMKSTETITNTQLYGTKLI